jgi:hypothetical protein
VHGRKRGVESFEKREKMSREGKIKIKYVYGKERKKNRKAKKKINMCMRE